MVGQSKVGAWVKSALVPTIVAKHHIIAAVGMHAQGNKHLLGLAPGSIENAKVLLHVAGPAYRDVLHRSSTNRTDYLL